MAAVVPAALLLSVTTERPRKPRFHRVCVRHRCHLREGVLRAGHGHVELMSCPGTRRDPPHRIYAWGVLDELRGRVVAIGSEGRVILLEGFDVPKELASVIEDVAAFVDQVEEDNEAHPRWVAAMAKLPGRER